MKKLILVMLLSLLAAPALALADCACNDKVVCSSAVGPDLTFKQKRSSLSCGDFIAALEKSCASQGSSYFVNKPEYSCVEVSNESGVPLQQDTTPDVSETQNSACSIANASLEQILGVTHVNNVGDKIIENLASSGEDFKLKAHADWIQYRSGWFDSRTNSLYPGAGTSDSTFRAAGNKALPKGAFTFEGTTYTQDNPVLDTKTNKPNVSVVNFKVNTANYDEGIQFELGSIKVARAVKNSLLAQLGLPFSELKNVSYWFKKNYFTGKITKEIHFYPPGRDLKLFPIAESIEEFESQYGCQTASAPKRTGISITDLAERPATSSPATRGLFESTKTSKALN